MSQKFCNCRRVTLDKFFCISRNFQILRLIDVTFYPIYVYGLHYSTTHSHCVSCKTELLFLLTQVKASKVAFFSKASIHIKFVQHVDVCTD